MATFGVGAAGKDGLQWGSPDVAGCLRGSVRRVANKLRKDGEWGVFTNLVDHMENRRGVAEIEAVLGFRLGEASGSGSWRGALFSDDEISCCTALVREDAHADLIRLSPFTSARRSFGSLVLKAPWVEDGRKKYKLALELEYCAVLPSSSVRCNIPWSAEAPAPRRCCVSLRQSLYCVQSVVNWTR